ncbi:MAG: PD-(D/E)XK nuclease family protein [Bacteroidales bacterium]|nr:PD-(D/E)XK nuclease family protein [Bacteroidales bacterium]
MNMDSFLYGVAKDIVKNYNNDFSKLNIIFPNKRAITFFNEAIYELINKPFLSPNYYTITDFLSKNSSLVIGDDLSLVYELYRVYSEVFISKNKVKNGTYEVESFDSFFIWGKMLLSDFDDIDKNLADPKSIFRNIEDFKTIDDVFDFLTDEQKKVLEKFFSSFRDENKTELGKRFSKIWNSLNEIYHKYNTQLIDKGIGYSGMIYRHLANNIQEVLSEDENEYAIIGFNVLNEAEKRIFFELKTKPGTRFYWDYDLYYKDDIKQEAGLFIRQNLKDYPMDSSFEVEDKNIESRKQDIEIVNSSGESAQINYLSNFFKKIEQDKDLKQNEIAIILGNESLLQSVLNVLPQTIASTPTKVNITMGYEFTSTPLFSLINSYIEYQSSLLSSKTCNLINLLPFLENAYWNKRDLDKVISPLKKNRLTFVEDISVFGFGDILDAKLKPLDLIDAVDNILLEIAKDNSEINYNHNSIDNVLFEIIYRISTSINRLRDTILKDDINIDINLFHKILIVELSSISIPFEGDPFDGVQIMGLLETRTLDFKYVIFLSCNDDLIPRVSNESSFIPHNIRFAYNLNTINKKISLFAYYFYRLLHRSKYITFVYNSSNTVSSKKEISRFLNQIIIEFKTHNALIDNKNIIYNALSSKIEPEENNIIEVIKQESHIEKIKNKEFLSASFLNEYLDCPLRFYFSKIADINPFEPYDQNINPMDFGNIFHKSAMNMYNEITQGKRIIINKDEIDRVLKDKGLIDRIVREAFRSDFLKSDDKNINIKQIHNINIEVIKQYIINLLEYDKQNTPFEIIAMEETFRVDFKGLRFGGIIDRIDYKDGNYKIIDYKTGSPEKGKVEGIEDLFFIDGEDCPKRLKNRFQIHFYSWLFFNDMESQKKYGINNLTNISSELRHIIQLNNENKEVFEYNIDLNQRFTDQMSLLIDEIQNNLNQNYSRRKSEKNCIYCNYQHYCY